ncbi:GRAM domain-containing protein 4-like protein [Lates japonicus]|uniref:GRAM domain-containing protein 4-like protein n=1 Tax=Lates japonicus TaxID=270547 RepID=A0AAD3MV12_LATJO|nr:GRAM domain-containing protein 4-like protein [Lates japonicus]
MASLPCLAAARHPAHSGDHCVRYANTVRFYPLNSHHVRIYYRSRGSSVVWNGSERSLDRFGADRTRFLERVWSEGGKVCSGFGSRLCSPVIGHVQRRDEFLDLTESPYTSDTECTEEVVIKPRLTSRESEELREVEGEQQSDAQVYMYTAWNGWVILMFLFLAILRLSLNYLIARGWRIQWSIVLEVSEPVEPPKEDLTVSEKFQLVLDVAQKAQNLFGKMANILEKIKNLFMWVQPELTQKLYVAVYAGIKFFIIDFIFKSCPKLRQRFDTPYIIWTNLPTDLQLKERSNTTLSRRATVAGGRGSLTAAAPMGVNRDEDGGRYYSTKRGAFHEVFNLPESERPLAVCENGWRCCLINRDRKTPTDYIRNGVLYVTENHLCFESSSSRSGSSKRNKVIKLLDIKEIQKYKVLSVLPGSGMGISIATPSTQKPMVFGAMMHRDEAFDAISTQYNKILAMATAASPET